jgi:hypothetical protein
VCVKVIDHNICVQYFPTRLLLIIPNCEKSAENISINVHRPIHNFQLLLQGFNKSEFSVKIFGKFSNIYINDNSLCGS